MSEERTNVFVANYEVEYDGELFGDQGVIELKDGYEWRGSWLLAFSMLESASKLSTFTKDPAVHLRKLRVGSIGYRVLKDVSEYVQAEINKAQENNDQHTEENAEQAQDLAEVP